MKESVLILGASLMQKPAILSAKEEGFKTFVIDANPKSLCVPLSDSFEKIDLKDKEKIYEYAKFLKENENLKGVFTSGTDFSSSVSFAAEKLGFHSHSYDAAMNASIKSRMRECFKKEKVPSPNFYSVQNDEEAAFFYAEKLGFPCVVKPCDNMGARGCRLIRNKDEALPSIKDAFSNSKSGTIILENYMDGPEFSIDALIYDGTMTITGFADRIIRYSPYFIETGHTIPSLIDEEKRTELISVFALGAKSLGLTEGAAKADIKYTKNGPEIGEIAARLSGGYMSGWTFPYSSDFNLTKEALKIATGRFPDELINRRKKINYFPGENLKSHKEPFSLYEIPSVRTSAERAWISIPGKIQEIINLNEKTVPEIKNVFPRDFSKGSEVCFPRNNVQKCGNSISVSENYEKAVNESERSSGNFLIRLEKNNKKTEDFLNCVEKDYEKGFPPSAFSFYEKIKAMNINGTIKENENVLKNVPDEIKVFFENPEKDFNYRTFKEEAELFDKIEKKHAELDLKKFWLSLSRGGIQGSLYFSDTFKD